MISILKNKKIYLGVLFLGFMFFVFACGAKKEKTKADSQTPEGTESKTETAQLASTTEGGSAGTASISGSIKYDGVVPKFKAIKMDADPICAAKHTEPVMPEALVLGEGNTLANVLVKITQGVPDQEFSAPTEAVVINQKGCKYTPHVVGMMKGQKIKFLNPDGTMHNVHALCKVNTEFNMGMPKFKKEAEKSFKKTEDVFAIKCDVHPWMGCWVEVFSHPFFSVSAMDGTFKIEGLGPGTYEVTAWHEKLGTKTASITIASDGEAQTADFTFSKPGA